MPLLKTDKEAYTQDNVNRTLNLKDLDRSIKLHPWWEYYRFEAIVGLTIEEAWNKKEWIEFKDPHPIRHPHEIGRKKPELEYRTPDLRGVSPKPTFDEIKGWIREREIEGLFAIRRGSIYTPQPESVVLANVSEAAKKLATAPIAHSATTDGDAIHIGGGIDRFSAISHILEDTTTAGKAFPRSVFRTLNRDTVTIWHEQAGRELVGKVARTANDIESAKNIVYNQHRMQLEIIREDALSIGIRIKAVNEFEALRDPERLRADLIDALRIVEDRDLLPRDLETAKITLMGRLEARATGKVKDITNAITQHGIDLPPSCYNQETAMTLISHIKQATQIEIERQETVEDAKVAFDVGVENIDEVNAINIPIWTLNGEEVKGPLTIDYSEPLVFIASHPDGSSVEGNVAITIKNPDKKNMAFIKSVPVKSPSSHLVQVTANESGKIRLVARNICGSQILNITLNIMNE